MRNCTIGEIQDILKKYLVEDDIEINKDDDIRDLNIDSIAYIQFLAEIEEKFNVDFSYDEISSLKDVSISNLQKIISAH